MSSAFGQTAPLTTTLRNVLRDYSGAQVLNEQLQNADDAGARTFKVLLDGRARAHRGTATLVAPALAALSGPALYCYDDKAFAPEDFASIQRVGDGLKRGDPTRTGQFGLGFNSVYVAAAAAAAVAVAAAPPLLLLLASTVRLVC